MDHRRRLECADDADAGIVDQNVDRAGGGDRGGNAVGAGDIQRQKADALRGGKEVRAGERMVAITVQPSAWKWRAVSSP
nr:hypothetical protein [Marinicella sp. W31]MDC2878855.1 hypothetical protein [Marinicella sp. W31]